MIYVIIYFVIGVIVSAYLFANEKTICLFAWLIWPVVIPAFLFIKVYLGLVVFFNKFMDKYPRLRL